MKMLTRPTLLATFNTLLLLPFSHTIEAASNTPKKDAHPPCTVQSLTTGAFFDLSTISLSPPELKDGRKVHKTDRDGSWEARGHDYGTNFTINICAPVIENVGDVVGVEKSRWQNISAYYERKGKVYSLGSDTLNSRYYLGDEEDDGEHATVQTYKNRKAVSTTAASDSKTTRRKSTIMSFLCDREAAPSQATVSFVGTMDSCTYFFEVRTFAACGGVAAAPEGGLGPAGIFGVIALIAIFVYLLGGCAYQRSVMHQRGWRQCPNYSMWSELLGFFKDFAIIIFSSLTRCFTGKGSPSSAGYSRANGQNGLIGAIGGRRGGDRGGRGDVDAENRLIDQLDEEWND
uniref:Autophagy-related protein 27 n=1 Tax=Talaromyces marneffei PM1 TaxID=1077442 RepID=A0A093VE39_TALMA